MDELEHVIELETENLQDLTEDTVRQTEELWTKVTENYNQMQDGGQDFLQKSSTIHDDSTIDIRSSTNTVERILSEYRERMAILSTTHESWTSQVDSSRQFKTLWDQFVQDARETIDRVLKIKNDFSPVISGDLGCLVQTAQRYQNQFEEISPVFKNVQEEIERHLSTAELLSLKGNIKGQKDQIISELTKVEQQFTARIHEYQILFKMTIQFLKNLDQLDRLIERTEKAYMESDLPSEISQAERLLEEHKHKEKEMSNLINYTADEGEKIVVLIRQMDAEAVAHDDGVYSVLKVTAEYKQRWNKVWGGQEKCLKQNLQICQFNFDLRQIHSEIDELQQHLQARGRSYCNSLQTAKTNSKTFKQFEMTVEMIEEKILNFSSTAELLSPERHDDAVHIDRELNLLKTKWRILQTSVRDNRQLLECSVEYFDLFEESEIWIQEGITLFYEIQRHMNEYRSPIDAEHLGWTLEKFIENGLPKQEFRYQKMSELVTELHVYGEEIPCRFKKLFLKNQTLIQLFQRAENCITQVKAQLKDREAGQHVNKEIQQLEVTSTAPLRKAIPPTITMPLKDAEVMEGENVTLVCQVDSVSEPEVIWYKDYLRLNNPVYETRYNRGVATLTIKETFSEVTGKYTIFLTNEAGTVESSAYLHVRERMEQEEVMRMKRTVETKESKVKDCHEDVEHSPQEFQKRFHDLNVNAGDSVTFECSIAGAPKQKVTWLFNGQPLDSRGYKITMEGNIYRLYIPEVSDEDAGRFSITVENPSGKTTCSTLLSVDENVIFDSSEYSSRRFSHTERVTSTETRMSRAIMSAQQHPYIPSTEQLSTNIITDIEPRYEQPQLTSQEHYATTIMTDLRPRYQPVDLTTAVPVPPKYTQALKNIQAMEGSKVIFEGVVTGIPEPSIKWFRENRELTDQADFEFSYKDGHFSLTIPEVFQEDAGQFTCTAKNVAGSVTSSAELVIKGTSDFMKKEISPETRASPEPQKFMKEIEMTREKQLLMFEQSFEPYNKASEVSDKPVVTTKQPPNFTKRLQDRIIKEGDRLILEVYVEYKGPEPIVRWYWEGLVIRNSPDYKITFKNGTSLLSVAEVFLEDTGVYKCVATNADGSDSTEAMLRVIAQSPSEFEQMPLDKCSNVATYVPKEEKRVSSPVKPQPPVFLETPQDYRVSPPVFKKKPEDREVHKGNTVRLDTLVSGQPVPELSWFLNGRPLHNDDHHKIVVNEDGVNSLIILGFSRYDSGTYKCVAENRAGKISFFVTLKVTEKEQRQPPKFVERMQNFTVKEGQPVTLTCNVTGDPVPMIGWQKDGKMITHASCYQIYTEGGRTSLTIPAAHEGDSAWFQCSAANVAGTASTRAKLTVQAKPKKDE